MLFCYFFIQFVYYTNTIFLDNPSLINYNDITNGKIDKQYTFVIVCSKYVVVQNTANLTFKPYQNHLNCIWEMPESN